MVPVNGYSFGEMQKTKEAPFQELGTAISTLRKRRGMTLEKLAYEMEISKGNLSDIENGRKDPRFSTLKAIAEGLGVSVSQLLKDL